MRFVQRKPISDSAEKYLSTQRTNIGKSSKKADFSSTTHWENRRDTIVKHGILGILKEMAGSRERCMYCLDSHATDIEHHHPKSLAPYSKMFEWANFLLCCTDCGRIKSNQFPLDENALPLLINPSEENPWQYLDFDPLTGNITATYQVLQKGFSKKGQVTVEVLALDAREQLAKGYFKTWNRLVKAVEKFLKTPYLASEFIDKLLEKDDHHLLGWCFHGTGENEYPFNELKQRHPQLWQSFVNHPELLIPATQEKL